MLNLCLPLTSLMFLGRNSLPLSLLADALENRDLAGFKTVFRTLQFHWPDHPEVQALLFKSLLVTRRGHSIVSCPQWASVSDPQLRLVFSFFISNGSLSLAAFKKQSLS